VKSIISVSIFFLFSLFAYGSVQVVVNENGTTQEAAPAPAAPAVTPESPAPENNFPVRLISRTPIEYPKEAQTAKVQGTVVVELLIDEMGQVMTTTVVSGDKRLAKAVVKAVKLWRFEPKMENGRTVVSTYTLPINFKLKSATNSTNSTN